MSVDISHLQWLVSISVTCTPPVFGIVVGVSIGNGHTHFESTPSMCMIKFAVPCEQ